MTGDERVDDVASSTVAAAAAFSRHSNDSGDEWGDDDGEGKIIINTFISLYSNLFLICHHLYHSYVVLAIPHCWNSVASSTIGGSGGDGESTRNSVASSTIGGGGGDGEANVGWGLTKIFTLNELKKSNPTMCMNKNCGLVACSQWESTDVGKLWNTCLDCQAA
jgi:hypothetical protein